MDIQKVRGAALRCFAEYGYEETSLSQIAGDIGIKKQSLATYYKCKEDLLFATLDDEYHSQMAFVDEAFSKDDSPQDLLLGFLERFKERYDNSPGVKFWLRMTLFEKIALDERAWPKIYSYLDHLKSTVQQFFPDDPYAADAYLGIYDSLCVELLLGGREKADQRLTATWNIFWRGVNTKEQAHE